MRSVLNSERCISKRESLTCDNHRQGLPLPDPYLKLHDVRFLRPLSPIPFPTPPAFVRFHPRLQSTVIVASAEGRIQTLDLKDVSKSSSLFQVSLPLDSSLLLTRVAEFRWTWTTG